MIVPADEHLPKHPKNISARVDASSGPRGQVKVQTTVVMPRPVARAVRKIAIAEKRSMSDVMSRACRFFLDATLPGWESQLP